MARTGVKAYAWMGGAYCVVGLVMLFRHYYAFGMMWIFFGLAVIAEFLRERNPSTWMSAAKWASLALGLVMIGLALFVRRW